MYKNIDSMIEGTWKEQHKQVIEGFLQFLNSKSKDYILKGGTSLMECYGLNRFSEDIDLDSPNKEAIFHIVEDYAKNNGFNIRIAKDTGTVSRFMLDYHGRSEEGDKPLKIEISHRRKNIPSQETTVINGINVYKLDYIAMMKANAYSARDKIRDLYDLCFIVNHKMNELNPMVIDAIREAVGQKGLDQFDYIISSQSDELIDNDELETAFLNMFDSLDLLIEKDPLEKSQGIDDCSIAEEMESAWHEYFEKPKCERKGIEWNGKLIRPALFDDLYLAQCQLDGMQPEQEIYNHFWNNCVAIQEYTPQYCQKGSLDR